MADLKIFDARCQFCLRSAGDGQQLISGNSASICGECVERCRTVLSAEPAQEKPKPSSDRYLYQRLARHFAPLPPQELFATSRSYPLRQQADLQNALELSQPTVSHHLKVLVDAGFLERSKRGTWAYYALVPGALDGIAKALAGPATR